MRPMKKHILLLSLYGALITSCLNNDFMDRTPLDKLIEATAFTTNENFRTYMWKYYENSSFQPRYNYNYQTSIYDLSDNACNQGSVNSYHKWGWDTGVVPTSGGGWNFSTIRGLNMMLDNIEKSQLTSDQQKHWRSVGYFFKSLEYFRLMQIFGDLPWLENYITDDNTDVLYAARESRIVIADKILEMLNYAKENISTQDDGANTINKHCVNALLSRFGLYEGTWEKYHKTSNAEVYTKFLQASFDASKELMTAYPRLISSYDAVFNSKDLAGKDGIILYQQYLNMSGYGHLYLRYTRARALMCNPTADVVKSYLCTDGRPIYTSAVYEGNKQTGDDPMFVEFMNRDRRLYYTIVPPFKLNNKNGQPLKGRVFLADIKRTNDPNDSKFIDLMEQICKEDGSEKLLPILQWEGVAVSEMPHIDNARYSMGQVFCNSRGGYYNWKYYNTSTDIKGGQGDTDVPIFRMGEILVNHAEVAFELGLFDQSIADLTINKLRERAHISKMVISNIDAALDPTRDADVNPVLWEIRRERRVELMAEGFRFDDICRWKKGEYLSKTPLGAFVHKTDLEDKRHQNSPNIALFDLAISGEDEGRIIIYGTKENPQQGAPNPGWTDKYYLSPLPIEDLLLNNKLQQNDGWPRTNADKQ